MLDSYVHGRVTRISPEAPTPIVEITRRIHCPGGAANVAVNARALGASVTLAGACGDDENARHLQRLLSEKDISCVNLVSTPNARTIVKERVVANGGHQICRIDIEDSPAHYRVDIPRHAETLKKAILKSHAVILSDYAKGVIDDELLKAVSLYARQAGIPVILDPKPKHPLNFGGLVDIITPNRAEAMLLAGMDPHRADFPAGEVCQKIHARYHLEHLVVTMSEEGLLLCPREGQGLQIPTYACEVCDVTGAGDTFVAAMACALAAKVGIREAAELANTASGVVVGKTGTAVATPSEIMDFDAKRALSFNNTTNVKGAKLVKNKVLL